MNFQNQSRSEKFPERKKPAHHPVMEDKSRSIIVFLTVCTKNRRPILANERIHSLLLHAWQKADAWSIGSYVVMPDHLHIFCAPHAWPVIPLTRWVAFWKSLVARAIVGQGVLAKQRLDISAGVEPRPPDQGAQPDSNDPLWQTSFWDTQLRSGESYSEKWEYIRRNSVRAGLVESPELWPYQGVLNVLPWHD